MVTAEIALAYMPVLFYLQKEGELVASMQRTIVRAIYRKRKNKVKKEQKKVVVDNIDRSLVKILKIKNEISVNEKMKSTPSEKFKNMIQNIVKKVKSWVA